MDKRMKCNRAVAVACGLLMITCGRASCTPKPVYGTWGLDFAGEDRVTKPGDDFFRFANGARLDRTQIPPINPPLVRLGLCRILPKRGSTT
jgi:putative endopeptidase